MVVPVSLDRNRCLTRCVVLSLLALHAALLAFSGSRQAPTIDEPAHLLAGLSYWEFGRFDLFRVNPPLPRLIASSPVLAFDYDTDWSGFTSRSAARPEFAMSWRFVKLNSERFMPMLISARWACIPFSLLGAWVCYRWGTELYGVRAGLLSLLLWTFSPTVLAHGQLITCDVAAASFGSLAMFALWSNIRSPSSRGMLRSGVTLGVALLCKATLVILLPLVVVLWLIAGRSYTQSSWSAMGGQIVGTIVIGLFILNLGYGFEDSGRRLGDFEFSSRMLTGNESTTDNAANRFEGTWMQDLVVPLPANFVLGVDSQKIDHETHNQPSFMHGVFRSRGWFFYYAYAALVKVPVATWLLGVVVAIGKLRSACTVHSKWRDEFILLAPAALVLVVVSSQTRFTHHFRYVLPVFPLLFIWVGQAACISFKNCRVSQSAVVVLTCWSIVSCLTTYPHTLSYFNEFVGGPSKGHQYLLGSNLDWGQDLFYLKRWKDEHPEATPLSVAYWGAVDASFADMRYQLPPFEPTVGWHAVSINIVKGRPWPVPLPDGTNTNTVGERYRYFESLRPHASAGYSIIIFHVGADELRQVIRHDSHF